MNIQKNWLLAFVILSGNEIGYSGPLKKTVATSVGVGTYCFGVGHIGRVIAPLFEKEGLTIPAVNESAIFTGIAAGMVAAPIFSGIHSAHIRHEVESSKHHWTARCHARIQDAEYDIIAHSSSPLVKEKSRKNLIAFQLALHKIDAFDKKTASSALPIDCDLLGGAPAILTVCGFLPAFLCDCSPEIMQAILAASYCSGGSALLHAKIQEHRWNPIKKQVEHLLEHGLTDKNGVDIEIPHDFIYTIDEPIVSKAEKDKIQK